MKTILLFLGLLTLPLHARTLGKTLSINHNPSLKLIKLKAVTLKGVKWNEAVIKFELERVNRIYSQCSLQINEVELLSLNSSSTVSEISDVQKIADHLEKIKFKTRKEVVAIFAGELGGELKMMGGEQTGGFSFNHSNLEESSEEELVLENVAVLLDRGHTTQYKKIRHTEYSPIAHELGHILLNMGHMDTPNLMASSPALVTPDLTAEQCSIIEKSVLFKP